MLANLESKALHVVDIWQKRSEQLVQMLNSSNIDESVKHFQQLKSAFANFRVVVAQAESAGFDVFEDAVIRQKAQACYEATQLIDKTLRRFLDAEAIKLRKLKRTTENLGKFRSADIKQEKSKFIKPVQV